MTLVREDRVERTAGVWVVLPKAWPSSYRAAQISAESILSAKLTSRLDFPMTSLKDYQVDRRKMEVRQRMQSKRTNRDIDFLRPMRRTLAGLAHRGALTGYWCLSAPVPVCRDCFDLSQRRAVA